MTKVYCEFFRLFQWNPNKVVLQEDLLWTELTFENIFNSYLSFFQKWSWDQRVTSSIEAFDSVEFQPPEYQEIHKD
jgi:hypothetical protein